jgi:regulator of RNase E activity RraA
MQIGSLGTFINQIITDVVAVDPDAISANTSGTVDVTISNVQVGDIIVLTPPSSIEDDLIFQGATVTAANTVTIKIRNLSGVAVNGASRDWSYIITRKTP